MCLFCSTCFKGLMQKGYVCMSCLRLCVWSTITERVCWACYCRECVCVSCEGVCVSCLPLQGGCVCHDCCCEEGVCVSCLPLQCVCVFVSCLLLQGGGVCCRCREGCVLPAVIRKVCWCASCGVICGSFLQSVSVSSVSDQLGGHEANMAEVGC